MGPASTRKLVSAVHGSEAGAAPARSTTTQRESRPRSAKSAVAERVAGSRPFRGRHFFENEIAFSFERKLKNAMRLDGIDGVNSSRHGRIEKRPVCPLAGHIGVETRRSHLRNHRSTGARHDADALHALGAKGHHSRGASEHGSQRAAQVVTRPSAFSPNAERRAVIGTELATDR